MQDSNSIAKVVDSAQEVISDASNSASSSLSNFIASESFNQGVRVASKAFDSASQTATELYGKASTYVSQNRKAVSVAGALLAVGAVGFVLGRSLSRSSSKS